MMAKPMKTLGLHYPMVKFLIKKTLDNFGISLCFCVKKIFARNWSTVADARLCWSSRTEQQQQQTPKRDLCLCSLHIQKQLRRAIYLIWSHPILSHFILYYHVWANRLTSSSKLNLRRDFPWVATRTHKFPCKYTEVAKTISGQPYLAFHLLIISQWTLLFCLINTLLITALFVLCLIIALRSHPICSPPRRGQPSWFPLVPTDWGIWASRPGDWSGPPVHGDYPRYHSIMSPPRESRVKRFPATRSCPLPFVYFLCDPLLRTSMQNHRQLEEFWWQFTLERR